MRYAIAAEVRSPTARRAPLGLVVIIGLKNSLFHEHVAKRIAKRVIFVAKYESPFSFVQWVAKDSQLADIASLVGRHITRLYR